MQIRATLSLLKKLALADLKKRYASSYLGVFWAVGQPLLMSVAYILVFSMFMGDVLPSKRYAGAYFVPYYMLGFALWVVFADIVGRSPFLLREHQHLVTKIKFPHIILPIQLVLSASIPFATVLAVGLVSAAVKGCLYVPVQFYYPLLAMFCAMLLTLGCAWVAAAIGVYISDFGQLIGVLLMLGFFATPILYPLDLVLQRGGLLAGVVKYNPFTIIVDLFRGPLMGVQISWSGEIVYMLVISVAIFFFGIWCYRKLEKGFADVL